MAKMLITLQGKGGVGKSFLTGVYAQWALERGYEVICVDTDTLNPTLAQYGPLNATHIKLSNEHVINPLALDDLIGIVDTAGSAQVVVDVGSNGFETLMAYEVENGVFETLAAQGHEVVIQTVLAGGPDAEETIKGTMALLKATTVPVILWFNEHLGPLEYQGRSMVDMKFIREAGNRVLGIVVMHARTRTTFGKAVEEMLSRRLTFTEAIACFDLMPRTRIQKVRDDLYGQLDAVAGVERKTA